MSEQVQVYHNGQIFDGSNLRADAFAVFAGDTLVQIGEKTNDFPDGERIDLAGDILSIGFVDLQVNGGGGVMFNDNPSVATLAKIAAAHRKLGVTALLPTLITDTPEQTQSAIKATIDAIAQGVPGIVGLHLEGPHLSNARKGAHDPRLIRQMEKADLGALLDAAKKLPCLKVTVAPENVSLEQVAQLAQAGVIVSLGHSDADFETCQRYFEAGAQCTTHLFNAMSQIGNRAPGLAGAAIAAKNVCAGLIADGIHVHPETINIAWKAKRGQDRLFLVSDAMAVAGTNDAEFKLGERKIFRKNGELRLGDGTLAGADLDLVTAVSTLVNRCEVSLQAALKAATSVPAGICGLRDHSLRIGNTRQNNVIRIAADLSTVRKIG